MNHDEALPPARPTQEKNALKLFAPAALPGGLFLTTATGLSIGSVSIAVTTAAIGAFMTGSILHRRDNLNAAGPFVAFAGGAVLALYSAVLAAGAPFGVISIGLIFAAICGAPLIADPDILPGVSWKKKLAAYAGGVATSASLAFMAASEFPPMPEPAVSAVQSAPARKDMPSIGRLSADFNGGKRVSGPVTPALQFLMPQQNSGPA